MSDIVTHSQTNTIDFLANISGCTLHECMSFYLQLSIYLTAVSRPLILEPQYNHPIRINNMLMQIQQDWETCVAAFSNQHSMTTFFFNGGIPGVTYQFDDSQLCFFFPPNDSNTFNVNQFIPLTYIGQNNVGAFGSYSYFIDICPCSSNGMCLVPTDAYFQPRNGTVLKQDCICDASPGMCRFLYNNNIIHQVYFVRLNICSKLEIRFCCSFVVRAM